MVSTSAATRKALREEKIAKGLIRTFAFLTIVILVWIIGYILFKGFYTDTRRSYKVTPRADIIVETGGSEPARMVFIVNRGIRIRDIPVYDLITLFTKPRNDNWGFHTGQDIKVQPFGFKGGVAGGEAVSFAGKARLFLLGDADQFPGYVSYAASPQEMIERVARTPGGIGYLPASWLEKAKEDRRLRLLPVRQTAAAVNGSVTAVEHNRIFREIDQDQLERIFSGETTSWREIGGRDLPITPVRFAPAEPAPVGETAESVAAEPGVAFRTEEELVSAIRTREGAIALVPYSLAARNDLQILDVLRRERGPNLSLDFLFKPPARSGQWGGISYIIVNTFFLILFTLLISTPVGVAAAIYLVEYAKQGRLVSVLRMGTETLAGVPSIIFGLFGNIFFVQILGLGIGFISSTLTVTLMILPTMVRTTEEALKAVPMTYREGSLALGATKLQTIFKVVLPAASPGILTGIILSVGRTVGETAVLLYTLGSSYELVRGPSSSARVLSLHLYLLFSEAISFERAFATAAVLIFIILAANITTTRLVGRMNRLTGHQEKAA